MKKIFLILCVLSLAVILYGQPIQASSLIVLNPGFEDLVLPGPGSGSNYSLYNIPSWNLTGEAGTWKPGPLQFPSGVPEGDNVAALGNTIGGGVISQILSATLQANTNYTLMVDVGQRLDYALVSYTVELIANGVTLSSDSSLHPAPGTFLTDTIIYNSGLNPAQLGQNLAIRLSAVVNGQAVFDNVRLDATAVPIPAAVWLLGSGLLGLIIGRESYENE
jgi:hypothetical protein